MDLHQLFIFSLLILAAIIVWQHLNVSQAARVLTAKYCDKNNLILLDQSVILNKVRIVKSNHSLFAIERQYHFEFSSVGDARYQGRITFEGKKMKGIQLDAFRV